MKLILSLCITALIAYGTQAATPEHLAKINKFFEIVQMQKQHETRLTAGFAAMSRVANLDALPEEERARAEKMMQRAKDFILAEMGWAKVKEDMANLYAEHFTEEEMDKIIRLLDNDTGRMLYSRQIDLLPGSLAYAQAKMQALAPKMRDIVQEQALDRAKSINCVNNLKQIGLSFRTWALDHEDAFPFQVSTNKGGTLELCARGTNGYDANSFFHFQVMSNELGTAKILVCPEDSSKTPSRNFQSLQISNVSYLVRSGTSLNAMNLQEILAQCPIHGHVLRCDGSVETKN